MISGVGGLIDASGVGDAEGDSTGVGDVEGVGLATGVGEGLTSGEFVACWFVCVQLANSNINPATKNAGTPPLFTLLSRTFSAANCIAHLEYLVSANQSFMTTCCVEQLTGAG
jgi:hypothetical protein